MNQHFDPVTEHPKISASHQCSIERQFANSLQRLCALHGLNATVSEDQVFPYNIWYAFSQAKNQLQCQKKNLELLIVETDNQAITLATAKALDTGFNLYYIPVAPVAKLFSEKKTRPLARLVLSAFCYLHKVVQIPFCDAGSYIGYTMSAIEDWVNDASEEWNETEHAEIIEQIKSIQQNITQFAKELIKPTHLKQFGQRLRKARGRSKKESELMAQIARLYQLYKSYPDRSFTDNLHTGLLHPETQEQIFPDQYLSFWWGGHSWLDEQVEEWVSNELEQMCLVNEPLAIQYFDSPQPAVIHDLFFESELIAIVTDLNAALYNL